VTRRPSDSWKTVGALAFHHHGPALVVRHVRQQLRVAKPAIGHDQGGGQRQPQPLQACRSIQHHLQPGQLVTGKGGQAQRVRATHTKIHRDQQRALADHDEPQQPIDPRRTRCSWPLYQVPTRPKCWPDFLKTLSSPTQVHWPATARGRAFILHLAPQAGQQICPGAATAAATSAWAGHPGSDRADFCPSSARGSVHGGCGKPNTVGHISPKILPKSFPTLVSRRWTSTPASLQAQVDQGSFHGFQRVLGASLLALETFAVLLKAAVLRVVLSSLVCVSWAP